MKNKDRGAQPSGSSAEFSRIAELLTKLPPPPEWVQVPAGDDAAVFQLPDSQVVSVDACVENVHFRWEWLSASDIGYRALCAALSDIAAMGATPRAVLFALACPSTLPEATLRGVRDGFLEAASQNSCFVLGGNMTRASELGVTTTVFGTTSTAPLTRCGAKEGDTVWVSGTLGRAGLGRMLLERGETSHPLCDAWRRPTARTQEGLLLSGQASAAIDISDGFAQDLAHLCHASKVGAAIEIEKLPIVQVSPLTEQENLQCALHGGEDYELIFTLPKNLSSPPFEGASKVGVLLPPNTGISFYQNGNKLAVNTQMGFNH